ncbi:MAG: AMP-binding protein [Spirochaetales bacterium]|nr:AMP-binding protein [Spirochaetales bacterium]
MFSMYSDSEISAIVRKDGIKMVSMREYTFCGLIDVLTAKFGKYDCYTVLGKKPGEERSMTYDELGDKVGIMRSYLLSIGFWKGDKIAIWGDSCPEWMVMYLAITTMGAIAVPILPGFTAKETEFALKNSGAKGICAQKKYLDSLKDHMDLSGYEIFALENLHHLKDGKDIDTTQTYFQADIVPPVLEEDIASIIYTSGTTGNSKGVQLSHKNILSCADQASKMYVDIKPGDRAISILPMSHVYEFTIGQLVTMLNGTHIYFLGRPAAVSVLLPALKSVRPHIMLTVPLIMEKIYKSSIAPLITNGGKLEKFYNMPIIGSFVARAIGHKLEDTFGGRLKFFGIGGAPLDPEVDRFLDRTTFPVAHGYGLTETSPLLAGCAPHKHKTGFIGEICPYTEYKLLDVNSEGVGEFAVKGPQVMRGYYNNDELNKESFTEDGYFRTGDLAFVDKKGVLGIKGRCKTMILGPAGENIYPEAIESVINNMEFVQESLVIDDEDNTLVGLIKIDIELMAKKLKMNLHDAEVEARKYVDSLKSKINKELSAQNKLSSVRFQKEPFQRTATQKIKRFLYQANKKNDGNKKGNNSTKVG